MAETRLAPLPPAFVELGAVVEPVVYADDQVDQVREQLLGLDGVLVWVNPLQDGADRSRLDALLREVADRGVWISTHPDVILTLGTKEILYTTRTLGWGTDTALYRSPKEFVRRFPQRLAAHRVLVVKQCRGTGGTGVWKIELAGRPGELDALVRVQHAATRDHTTEDMTLAGFVERCRDYFDRSGLLVDQPFQPRLADGMIRSYLVHDQVVGFSHQWPTGLLDIDPADRQVPAPRGMEDPDTPAYRRLRASLENDWIPQLKALLGIDPADLPVIWDADFLYGPKTADGTDTYVLCEINVSCVWPFPEQAAATIAQAALHQIQKAATPPNAAPAR